MPSLRRRAQPQPSPPPAIHSESDSSFVSAGASEDEQDASLTQDDREHSLLSSDHAAQLSSSPSASSPTHSSTHLPPNLREISTLASWTVSSSKPGCSIPQLRHPSPSLFWQSDGPQPHYLNIHFFKLVRIVGLRVYLDFEQDESYTPTRILLLAGSGMNDLVEWGEMKLESPRGWVWADFSGVGDPEGDGDEGEDDEDGDAVMDVRQRTPGPRAAANALEPDALAPRDDTSDFENTAPPFGVPPPTTDTPAAAPDPMLLDPPRTPLSPRKPTTPTLRCHLVQLKILENHQNGKDTHLRGLQIFARDGEKERKERRVHRVREREGDEGGRGDGEGMGEREREVRGLRRSAWMEEPVLR